jgi:predicted CopG family antitoxin
VTLNNEAYHRLQKEGRFGESYSELLVRLLEELDKKRDDLT